LYKLVPKVPKVPKQNIAIPEIFKIFLSGVGHDYMMRKLYGVRALEICDQCDQAKYKEF
jgi:hypothetical protein